MKTPDEIKKEIDAALEEASWAIGVGDAHDLIEALEKTYASMASALAYIQQLERERDAAVKDITHVCAKCTFYEHRFLADGSLTDRCGTCVYNGMCNWQWRGVQEVE
jgi:hypothetical protein